MEKDCALGPKGKPAGRVVMGHFFPTDGGTLAKESKGFGCLEGVEGNARKHQWF